MCVRDSGRLMLQPGEHKIVAQRVVEVLKKNLT
jgi:hypothetical protein